MLSVLYRPAHPNPDRSRQPSSRRSLRTGFSIWCRLGKSPVDVQATPMVSVAAQVPINQATLEENRGDVSQAIGGDCTQLCRPWPIQLRLAIDARLDHQNTLHGKRSSAGACHDCSSTTSQRTVSPGRQSTTWTQLPGCRYSGRSRVSLVWPLGLPAFRTMALPAGLVSRAPWT